MDKEVKKKITKIAAGMTVIASLFAGTLFTGVTDITPELQQTSLNQPPIVMDIDEFGNTTLEEDDDATEEKKGGGGLVAKIKQAVLSLPVAVRLLIVTPLWAIGTALMTIVSILGRTLFASPIGAFVMSVLVGFGVLVGLFAVTAKVIFPDVPLSKILTKGHIATLFVVAVGLAGVDNIAPLFWNQYPIVSAGVKLGTGALIIAILCNRVKHISSKLKATLSY